MTSLKNHMRLKCNRNKFQCDFCEKLFNNYSVMVVHERIENGEKPYKCVDCGDGFSCKSALKSHNKLHKEKDLSEYEIDESNTNLCYEPNTNSASYQKNERKLEQVSDNLNRFQQTFSGKCFYNYFDIVLLLYLVIL